MYVNLLSFKINEKKGISSNELSMIENYTTILPEGLDRFHVFKDKKKENKFYLIEYWNSVQAKEQMENSDKFETLNRIHNIAKKRHSKKIECDVII